MQFAADGSAFDDGSGRVRLYSDTAEITSELTYLLTNAKEVDIVGIAPHPLLDAVRQVASSGNGEPRVALASIRYFTPAPQIAYGHTRETAFAALLQRWNAAVTAFDNLLAAREGGTGPSVAEYGVHVFDDLFDGCLIRVRNESGSPVLAGLTALPGPPGREPVILWLSDGVFVDLGAALDELTRTGRPLRVREVHCTSLTDSETTALTEAPSAAEAPGLQIKRFAPYGGTDDQDFSMPAAIVAIRANTPSGVSVFLKRRTPLTDRNDFGFLSLLSARVLEEDLAVALGQDLVSEQDDEKAYEQTWIGAGKPRPFRLPHLAFVRAAQRELHISCGLSVSDARLVHRGYQVVQHERNDQQLCFAVFDLALIRSAELDELRVLESWNTAGMVRIDQDRLYSTDLDPLPLNRLLKVRREWLVDNIFKHPVIEQGT